ncbi:MAG: hypothetical protein OEZ39_16380 [Gammaproteobacteria bacterium]|nr:hypothetical protein [Gammaproteobacteria bacterium]MDH5653437.1 hypothetical protein [Gammaproteobacteria bacterium]
MKFVDIHINKENRFSLGTETESGKFYISIPVCNQMVDYEEYYETTKEIIDNYPHNIDEILSLIEKFIRHECDETLIIKPEITKEE